MNCLKNKYRLLIKCDCNKNEVCDTLTNFTQIIISKKVI